jgi:hypothetical protein
LTSGCAKRPKLGPNNASSSQAQGNLQTTTVGLEKSADQRGREPIGELAGAMLSSSHEKIIGGDNSAEVDEIQRDSCKGKAMELGILVKELMANPKLMADAQKASKSFSAYDPKYLFLLPNIEETVQGLSGIELSSSGEDDFTSDGAQGSQSKEGGGEGVLRLGLVKCSIKRVEKLPDKAELENLEIHTVKDQSDVVESEVVKRDVQENNMEVELYDGETGITDK